VRPWTWAGPSRGGWVFFAKLKSEDGRNGLKAKRGGEERGLPPLDKRGVCLSTSSQVKVSREVTATVEIKAEGGVSFAIRF